MTKFRYAAPLAFALAAMAFSGCSLQQADEGEFQEALPAVGTVNIDGPDGARADARTAAVMLARILCRRPELGLPALLSQQVGRTVKPLGTGPLTPPRSQPIFANRPSHAGFPGTAIPPPNESEPVSSPVSLRERKRGECMRASRGWG